MHTTSWEENELGLVLFDIERVRDHMQAWHEDTAPCAIRDLDVIKEAVHKVRESLWDKTLAEIDRFAHRVGTDKAPLSVEELRETWNQRPEQSEDSGESASGCQCRGEGTGCCKK